LQGQSGCYDECRYAVQGSGARGTTVGALKVRPIEKKKRGEDNAEKVADFNPTWVMINHGKGKLSLHAGDLDSLDKGGDGYRKRGLRGRRFLVRRMLEGSKWAWGRRECLGATKHRGRQVTNEGKRWEKPRGNEHRLRRTPSCIKCNTHSPPGVSSKKKLLCAE